jgi:L-threonylcarbamoyladenylate synthase
MLNLTLEEAAARLRNGDLLLYPTETFFGIGCKADDDAAIARIFQIKRRLFAMPLPIILEDAGQLSRAAQIPGNLLSDVERLAAAFWPGPFALILPARGHLSPLLTGGTGNIAVRVSSHPVPRELAKRAGEPLVASSANISGKPAVTRAEDIDPELLQAVGAVLDLPPSPPGGEPSTLVQPLGGGRLKLHRAGAVDRRRIQEAGFTLQPTVSA